MHIRVRSHIVQRHPRDLLNPAYRYDIQDAITQYSYISLKEIMKKMFQDIIYFSKTYTQSIMHLIYERYVYFLSIIFFHLYVSLTFRPLYFIGLAMICCWIGLVYIHYRQRKLKKFVSYKMNNNSNSIKNILTNEL
jgi:hypothetical protein